MLIALKAFDFEDSNVISVGLQSLLDYFCIKNKKAIYSVLRALQDKDYIRIKKKYGKKNIYVIIKDYLMILKKVDTLMYLQGKKVDTLMYLVMHRIVTLVYLVMKKVDTLMYLQRKKIDTLMYLVMHRIVTLVYLVMKKVGILMYLVMTKVDTIMYLLHIIYI